MRRYLGHKEVLGLAAVSAFALYLLSDLLEVLGGGFSALQLLLTFSAEATVPFIVVGLCMAQRPRLGRLGEAGALAFAFSYVLFAFTALYALVDGVPDYQALSGQFTLLFVASGGLMLLGGLAFAVASLRAEVFPRWTAQAVMAGIVLVVATQAAPDVVRLLPAALRDAGFIGMGVLLLRGRPIPEPGKTVSAVKGQWTVRDLVRLRPAARPHRFGS